MKLYLVKSAAPYFVSKQDEAKRDARSLKCGWEQVEVPTTEGREALAAFLNTLGGPASVQIVADEGEPQPEDAQDQQNDTIVESWQVAGARATEQLSATLVEEYILGASTATVEQIFARLGTRFAELAR